ncbi:helix-turn-helix domain-containing protein [Enterococcus casseliflavus]|uniref:helix-turn-helix domain-containing protein n=1 Tax=Enterococcus casseliflavus TaxID=37734 RepID=UPI002DBBCBA0|nr:helix-turn-helix transcriptional regulator [Enterococcus casseliflavus]MEB8416353.1 helix-turn-helix domain-containing protein [Enterococcus casseliflavus]
MNKKKLRILLLENDDNQGKLAEYLGISQQTLSKKINEKEGAEFSQTEIKLIKEKYNMSAEEVDEIFFAHCVS